MLSGFTSHIIYYSNSLSVSPECFLQVLYFRWWTSTRRKKHTSFDRVHLLWPVETVFLEGAFQFWITIIIFIQGVRIPEQPLWAKKQPQCAIKPCKPITTISGKLYLKFFQETIVPLFLFLKIQQIRSKEIHISMILYHWLSIIKWFASPEVQEYIVFAQNGTQKKWFYVFQLLVI